MHALLPLIPGLPAPDEKATSAGCSCMGARGGIAGIVLPRDDERNKEHWFFYSAGCSLHGRAVKERLAEEDPITL